MKVRLGMTIYIVYLCQDSCYAVVKDVIYSSLKEVKEMLLFLFSVETVMLNEVKLTVCMQSTISQIFKNQRMSKE